MSKFPTHAHVSVRTNWRAESTWLTTYIQLPADTNFSIFVFCHWIDLWSLTGFYLGCLAPPVVSHTGNSSHTIPFDRDSVVSVDNSFFHRRSHSPWMRLSPMCSHRQMVLPISASRDHVQILNWWERICDEKSTGKCFTLRILSMQIADQLICREVVIDEWCMTSV